MQVQGLLNSPKMGIGIAPSIRAGQVDKNKRACRMEKKSRKNKRASTFIWYP